MTDASIKQFMYQKLPSGNDVDTMDNINMQRGKRAKRVIDAARTNQNYFRTVVIQKPLLDHYENVDWFARETQFDLEPYIERVESNIPKQ